MADIDRAMERLMGNEELRNRRREVGMPQFLLAQRSGVTRMRLSLFETGQVALTTEEITAVRCALKEYIAQKAAQFTKALDCALLEHRESLPALDTPSFPTFGNQDKESYGVE